MKQYLVSEFIEEYESGTLSWNDLQQRVVGILGQAEGSRLLQQVTRRPDGPTGVARKASLGATVSGVEGQEVRIPLHDVGLLGYLARPTKEGTYPGILAIHENQGLVEHIKDCARRIAAEGYVVLAPDLLSRQGGTAHFPNPNDAIAALGQADPAQNTRDLVAAVDWLAAQPAVEGSRVGVTGWCMGGGYAWRVATEAGTRVRGIVPWYGPNPPGGVENIQAPVFAIYGELDQRINAGIEAITQLMARHRKSFEKKIYPNAQHAFNNDTRPDRYNPEQAKIAWADMLAFFARHLKA